MKKPKRGRPPTGPGGVRMTDLPRMTLRFEPETKARLQAAADVTNRPAWQVVGDAIAAYLDQMPAAQRREIRDRAR